MLDKETKQRLHDYIKINYNGDNDGDIMYNLFLELQDILFDVKEEIQYENGL